MKSPDLAKIAIAALSSVLLTGMASWLTFGSDKITRTDLQEYVSRSSPWIEDRGSVLATARENTKNIEKLEVASRKLAESLHQLIVEQRVMVSKVEALLKKGE